MTNPFNPCDVEDLDLQIKEEEIDMRLHVRDSLKLKLSIYINLIKALHYKDKNIINRTTNAVF